MGYFKHFFKKMWRKYSTYYIRGLISSLIVTFFFSLIPLLNPMSYAAEQTVVDVSQYIINEQASNQARFVAMNLKAYIENRNFFDNNLKSYWEQFPISGFYVSNNKSTAQGTGSIDFNYLISKNNGIDFQNLIINGYNVSNVGCRRIKSIKKRFSISPVYDGSQLVSYGSVSQISNVEEFIPACLIDDGGSFYTTPVMLDAYNFFCNSNGSDYSTVLNLMSSSLNTIQGTTSHIDTTVDDISDVLDDINSTLTTINTNIANNDYSQDLSNLQSSINTLNSSITSLINSTTTQNTSLNNSVNNVTNSVNDLSTTTQNGLNNVNTSVNNVSNSVNDLNNTISDNNVSNSDIDNSIGGLVDNSTDITEDGFATIFSSFIDSFSSGDSSVDVTIPFTNKSITISKSTVYGSFFTNNILGDLISAFYYFIVSWFIVIDIKRIFDKIKKGDIENSVSSDIREDLL